MAGPDDMLLYYTYVLYSLKDHKFYIGFSSQLAERMQKHHNGDVTSTKRRRPLRLIYYESYLSEMDALRREKYFKTRTRLKTGPFFTRSHPAIV